MHNEVFTVRVLRNQSTHETAKIIEYGQGGYYWSGDNTTEKINKAINHAREDCKHDGISRIVAYSFIGKNIKVYRCLIDDDYRFQEFEYPALKRILFYDSQGRL